MMTEMNFIVVEMRDVYQSERRERFDEYMMLALYYSSELEGTSQGCLLEEDAVRLQFKQSPAGGGLP